MYFIYIVRCNDDTLYCGITTDIARRMDEHNGIGGTSAGARYTQSRRPVTLVYSAAFPDRSSASRAEYRIKSLSRQQKQLLVSQNIVER